MCAAMAEESSPPERKTPSGTSDMSRISTACRRRSQKSAASSSSERKSGSGGKTAGGHGGQERALPRGPRAPPEARGRLAVGAQGGLGGEARPPVAAHAQLAVLVRGARGGRQLVDPRERGESRRHVPEAQVEV